MAETILYFIFLHGHVLRQPLEPIAPNGLSTGCDPINIYSLDLNEFFSSLLIPIPPKAAGKTASLSSWSGFLCVCLNVTVLIRLGTLEGPRLFFVFHLLFGCLFWFIFVSLVSSTCLPYSRKLKKRIILNKVENTHSRPHSKSSVVFLHETFLPTFFHHIQTGCT